MKPQDLTTREEVMELMQDDGPAALIDFCPPWCGPCRTMAPQFEAAAERMTDKPVAFYKVNTEKYPELSAAFTVRSLPTVVAVADGQIQNVLIGTQDLNNLKRTAQCLVPRTQREGFFRRLFGSKTKEE